MINKKITSLDIKKNKIPNAGEERLFSINGESGASFILQVVSDSNQFYNFSLRSFQNNFSSQTLLRSSVSGGSFTGKIKFPSGGSSYNVILLADPVDSSTLLDLPKGNGVINKKITQVSNSTVSFNLVTSNTSNYTTLPSLSSSAGSPVTSVSEILARNFTVTNVSNDSHGFGLILNAQLTEKDFVFRKTQTVNGATSSSFTVVLDDVTDVALGMNLTAVSSGSLVGVPFVKSVDADTKTVSLSSAQSLADGITLTFDAIGFKAIASATGLSLSSLSSLALETPLTKLVRTDISNSTTITVEGTYGIAKTATFSGSDVNNSSANAVQSVSASSSAGSFVCQVNQTLEENQTITFKGCTQSISVKNNFTISQYPASNTTISILLDNFITPGVGS